MTIEIPVEASRPYRVRVGRGLLGEVAAEVVESSSCFVLSDANVEPLYAGRLGALSGSPRVALAPGEGSKQLALVAALLETLAANGLDRQSALIALGGGVVGDVGGLVAALYMRGVDVVQVPTSLLAMVDASVGGKTAVNLDAGKNLAGAFHQPRAVIADTDTLDSLPDEELRSGLGEVLKTAILAGEPLLTALERQGLDHLRDPDARPELVAACVSFKAALVAEDEREAGPRARLNLGHTFAHGIERAAGYGAIPHGVAVACGIGLALEASARLDVLRDPELPGRVQRLGRELGLATDLAGLRERTGLALPADELLAGMASDKKGRAGRPALVLVEAAGAPIQGVEVEDDLLRELLA